MMIISPARAALLVTAVLAGTALAAPGDADLPGPYLEIRDRAEKLYDEGSYAQALRLYEQVDERTVEQLPAPEARWLAFRIADSDWRARAASRTHDDTQLERARSELERLINEIERPEDRDLAWAEAQESLGDYWWTRRQSRNWSQGWQHYRLALDWWAGHRDIKTARRRYLDMVWRMAEPPWHAEYGWYGYTNAPLDVLENARTIARTPVDRARAHYLLAMGLRQYGGSWQQRRRVAEEFEAAIAHGAVTPWYDDALYHYGEWLANNGRITLTPEGQWRQEPDFVRAVELYRRLVTEFAKGRTRYYDSAKDRIRQITEPQLSATVSSIFLPGSEVQFDVRWRNLAGVDFALYRVDLTRDVDPVRADKQPAHQWIWHIDPAAGRRIKAWTVETEDAGEHRWGHRTMRVDERLPVGAYLLVATGGGKTARELVLISDATLVTKAWRGKVLAYVCDAMDGSPLPGAAVRLWTYRYTDDRWTGEDDRAVADDEGLARFDVTQATRSREQYYGYLVTATFNGRQAFALGSGFNSPAGTVAWKIYATTDRPAYRPGETVQWKVTARTNDGSGYATPAGRAVEYEINGPRGKAGDGEVELNAFGSAWGSLELTESMALGEYQVNFWTKGRRQHIGSATLFRMEEYKLPEFEVAVSTPLDEDGRKMAFRLGETVEAQIEASYYFGGPVADANVEVLVYQKPFYHWWMPPREYDWYYAPQPYAHYWGGPGQIIKRQTLRTDGAGKAVVEFETPAGGGQDFEYRIEARVTDASRREISGADTVRVTRQRYYVHPRPRKNIYRPGETVEVDFTAVDANQQPQSVEGTVKVTRDRWVEIWIDPGGREVSGWQLREAKRHFRVFPPPAGDGEAGWRLKYRDYTQQEVLTRKIRTDADGKATVSFAARDEGYYRVVWTSMDDGAPITAQVNVWVADRDSSDIGYRSGGIEIIVDKDTFRTGQQAAVMLTVPTNDRWVLFSVEGDDLHECRLVHVTGTVKLIPLAIEQRHVPNVYLQALMVSDAQLFADREEVVVPPVENFLEVEVRADRESYEPRDEGRLTVITRDVDGKPVPAEVSLGLVDESVYYIQSPYAGDPRQAFYDRKQAAWVVQNASTFNVKSYIKLVEADGDDKAVLIDARIAFEGNERRDAPYRSLDEISSVGGGRMSKSAFADDMVANAPMEQEMSREEAFGMPAMEKRPPPGPAVGDKDGLQPGPAVVVVRTDFRSTIFWQPDVTTGADGTATVTVKYADNLTRWKATASAATRGARFGIGHTVTRTRRPLIARLQAPRFFVVGDTVTLSGVFNNNTADPMKVRPELEIEGLTVTGVIADGRAVKGRIDPIRVPAGGEARVDWLVAAESPGEAVVRLTARGEGHNDAMEMRYPVHEHGVERFLARSGKVRGEVVTVMLDIPAARKPQTTVLTVGVSSSMAVTMLDALPYLVQYPYGCTEQTMSRFLPAVITARTLNDLGLSADEALGKVFGGIEPQFVDKVHPKGEAKRENLRRLDVIVNQGLERLYDFQHGDGGWGWWKGGSSDHFMTAYVLWGLSLAREAGLDVRGHAMDRAARFLQVEIVEQETHHDMQAWLLHALSAYHAATGQRDVAPTEAAALANLWEHRDRLNAYSRALLALSAHRFGDVRRAQVLARNLENGVTRDDAPDQSILIGKGRGEPAVIGTAHWGDDGIAWRWSSGAVEATSFALMALIEIDPDNELIEPVTNWLVKNRRGAQWSNTRDTAITVLALNDYLEASGELEPRFEYELTVNGKRIAREKITAAEALRAPSRYVIDPRHIRDGANEITILRRNGEGPIYFSAEASFFSLEEPVPASGNEIFVRRDYYKLVPRETLLKGYVYDREPVHDGDYVTSGERVQVVVTVEAKNDYEYLVFEDLKPAGLEAVQLRSGESAYVRELKSGAVNRRFADPAAAFGAPAPIDPATRRHDNGDYTGRQRWVHQELRDRKVALFVDRLPEGVWEITYDLRAEIPGTFHALPVLGHAMYVPEIRCNSGEVRMTVNDRAPGGILAAGD